eukprot:54579_1
MPSKLVPATIVVLFAALCSMQNISCNHHLTEQQCVSDRFGACKWENNVCRCASRAKLDILFGVQASGAMGGSGFQLIKQFISTSVTQGINNNFTRIGFTIFATEVNVSRGLQMWDTNELQDYTNGLYWTRGWTNTPKLLTSVLTQFSDTKENDRQQILLLITNGNPCLPVELGGCPQSVCDKSLSIKSAGIRTIIIGVNVWDVDNTSYVDCLCQSEDDLIPNAIESEINVNMMNLLTNIFCPITTNPPTNLPTNNPTFDPTNSPTSNQIASNPNTASPTFDPTNITPTTEIPNRNSTTQPAKIDQNKTPKSNNALIVIVIVVVIILLVFSAVALMLWRRKKQSIPPKIEMPDNKVFQTLTPDDQLVEIINKIDGNTSQFLQIKSIPNDDMHMVKQINSTLMDNVSGNIISDVAVTPGNEINENDYQVREGETMDPYELLKQWKLKQYSVILIEEYGYDDVEYWKR